LAVAAILAGAPPALLLEGTASAEPQRVAAAATPTSTLPKAQGSVKFAVIGDSGTGGRAQRDIGRLLDQARAGFPYEFVLMLGDNMYGSEGARDFVRKFEEPYKPILAAGVQFYATLGNHDE